MKSPRDLHQISTARKVRSLGVGRGFDSGRQVPVTQCANAANSHLLPSQFQALADTNCHKVTIFVTHRAAHGFSPRQAVRTCEATTINLAPESPSWSDDVRPRISRLMCRVIWSGPPTLEVDGFLITVRLGSIREGAHPCTPVI